MFFCFFVFFFWCKDIFSIHICSSPLRSKVKEINWQTARDTSSDHNMKFVWLQCCQDNGKNIDGDLIHLSSRVPLVFLLIATYFPFFFCAILLIWSWCVEGNLENNNVSFIECIMWYISVQYKWWQKLYNEDMLFLKTTCIKYIVYWLVKLLPGQPIPWKWSLWKHWKSNCVLLKWIKYTSGVSINQVILLACHKFVKFIHKKQLLKWF